MARLIDADALLEVGRAKKLIEIIGNWDELSLKAKSACVRLGTAHKRLILAAPTVDAVEVVRCKDCKHWMKDVPGCTDAIGRCRFGNYMVGAAGYCVYGERKTNEAD